jgi:excisionase family DNA binding protein
LTAPKGFDIYRCPISKPLRVHPRFWVGELLTICESAKRFHVSHWTVRKWIKFHGLPYFRQGRVVRLDLVDIERFIRIRKKPEPIKRKTMGLRQDDPENQDLLAIHLSNKKGSGGCGASGIPGLPSREKDPIGIQEYLDRRAAREQASAPAPGTPLAKTCSLHGERSEAGSLVREGLEGSPRNRHTCRNGQRDEKRVGCRPVSPL